MVFNKECVLQLLLEYHDVFSLDSDYVDAIDLVQCQIDTGDARPIKRPTFRAAQK